MQGVSAIWDGFDAEHRNNHFEGSDGDLTLKSLRQLSGPPKAIRRDPTAKLTVWNVGHDRRKFISRLTNNRGHEALVAAKITTSPLAPTAPTRRQETDGKG